ncbi:MAG: peptidase S58 family protein [Anaerolineaceae bacterium]|nr:MAG: peptidase S58 family protein [Anaerolineaceae bacterium]
MNNTLTDIKGIRVGHATDIEMISGCTVILCPPNTVAGIDQRGGAPGTRETDLLRPMHLVENVHAIVLSGGSAHGLATADGVMRYLDERGIGYPVEEFVVPIVPAAILNDLRIGDGTRRPTAEMGYQAAQSATDAPVQQGNIGAGTGCRVAPLLGNSLATKGGLGSASIDLGDGLIVSALVAVNSVGDIIGEDGAIIGGARNPEGGFIGMMNVLRGIAREEAPPTRDNTVIGAIATNARLNKEAVNKVAQMAQDGIARAVRPAHTMYDGDTIFALATGEIPANVNAIGAFAAEAMAQAIRNAIYNATTLGGVRQWDAP